MEQTTEFKNIKMTNIKMTNIEILTFTGLLLNLIGTVILAFSLNKYLMTLHGAITIHDLSIKGIIKKDTKVLYAEEMGNLLTIGINSSAIRTKIGLIIICLGFIFQLIPFFVCKF